MIDTILFDLVGVLLFPNADYEQDSLVDEIDQLVGAVTDDAAFQKHVLSTYHLSDAEFGRIIRAIADKYEPYLPLWELLPQIRVRYKLGIINNGTFLTYPLFEEKYHLSRQFDVFVSSAVEGACKPDPAIYLRACEKLSSSPRNCLFMDDSAANIMAAQQLGMSAIHWPDRKHGFQAFKRYLRDLNGTQTAWQRPSARSR